jgi:hypothetical protein
MKKKMKLLKTLVFNLALLGLILSCETLELNDTQSPDNATPEQSELDLFLNSIQIDF